jgi:hypothetical protein
MRLVMAIAALNGGAAGTLFCVVQRVRVVDFDGVER